MLPPGLAPPPPAKVPRPAGANLRMALPDGVGPGLTGRIIIAGSLLGTALKPVHGTTAGAQIPPHAPKGRPA